MPIIHGDATQEAWDDAQQTFTDLEAFVWLAYRRDVSLNFRARLPRDRDEVKRILGHVGCYNAFHPLEAFAIIDGWWDELSYVELAREGSPALYFRFPYMTDEGLVDIEETTRLARMLIADCREDGADEVTFLPEKRTVRAWWD